MQLYLAVMSAGDQRKHRGAAQQEINKPVYTSEASIRLQLGTGQFQSLDEKQRPEDLENCNYIVCLSLIAP